MKIIGATVGTTLPKPNFNQTDPKKGDYIKNKPDIDGLQTTISEVSALVGDNKVSEQIATAMDDLATVAKTGSWNDLEDKPFYEDSFEYVYNGTKDDHGDYNVTIIERQDNNNELYAIKISDTPISFKSMHGSDIDIYDTYYQNTNRDSLSNIGAEFVENDGYFAVRIFNKDMIVSVLHDSVSYLHYDSDLPVSTVSISRGLYFIIDHGYDLYIKGLYKHDICQLDEKYLPENIQSDWSENDETSISYVKNRTHWDKSFDFSYNGNPEEYKHFGTNGYYLIKISDTPLNEDDYDGATLTFFDTYIDMECSEVISKNQLVREGDMLFILDEDLGLRQVIVSVFNETEGLEIGTYIRDSSGYDVKPRRFAKSNINQLDEKYIPDTIARTEDIVAPVQSDWNVNNENDLAYVKNRPFYESDSVTWDGNTDDLIHVADTSWYKVSDLTPYFNDLLGHEINITDQGVNAVETITVDSNPRIFEDSKTLIGIFIASQFVGVWIALKDHVLVSDGAYEFPEKGIYFAKLDEENYVNYLNFAKQIKRIDEKYLPENIQSDWNTNDENDLSYVKNRTHWNESYDFIYNGNYSDYEYLTPPGSGVYYVKMSDNPLSAEQLIGSKIVLLTDGEEKSSIVSQEDLSPGDGYLGIGDGILSLELSQLNIGPLSFSRGLYFIHVNNNYTSRLTKETIHQLDPKFIPDSIARTEDLHTVATSGSWNDIEDKPITTEPVTIEYNGDTEGYVVSSSGTYYKVSDMTLASDDLVGQVLRVSANGHTQSVSLQEDIITVSEDGIIDLFAFVIGVPEDNMTYSSMTFPESGVYFLNDGTNMVTSLTVHGNNGKPVFLENHIPSSIVRAIDLHDVATTGSWNDLEDRPMYAMFGIDWDGNTDGLDVVDGVRYRVSDYTPTREELIGKTLIFGGATLEINNNDYTERVGSGFFTGENGYFYFIATRLAPLAVALSDGANIGGTIFEKKGTYFINGGANEYTMTYLSINPQIKQLDEIYIPSTIARTADLHKVSTTGSWNDLEDKPFYANTGRSVDWDGNTENLESVMAPYGDVLYRISDYAPLKEELFGQDVIIEYLTGPTTITLTEQNVQGEMSGAYGVGFYNDSFMVVSDPIAVSNLTGVTFPGAGIYAPKSDNGVYISHIGIVDSIKQLDEKYIPGTIARVEDIPTIEYFTIDEIDEICTSYVSAEEMLF